MADYLDHSERWRTRQQPRRVDYTRPGFVRPADPRCDCPGPQHDPLCRFWPLYVTDEETPDDAA